MMPTRHATYWLGRRLAAVCLVVLLTSAAMAQGSRSTTGGIQGFQPNNRNEPIRIEAGNLEVRDKDKTATFSESVRVTQGEMTLECRKLIVHYVGDAASGGAKPRPAAATPAASPGAASPGAGGGNQQIKKLEAKGGVVITQKDQTAVGDEALYDAASNHVTLIGNVVLTQGQNTVRGDRLWVDMNTGVYEVKSSTGRVDAVFQPGSMKENARPGGQGNATPPPATPRNGAAAPAGSVSSQGSGRTQNGAADKDKSKQQPATPRPLKLN